MSTNFSYKLFEGDKNIIRNASPIILLIAGTSGTGKSTLANFLLNKYPDKFTKLVRSTTRKPRSEIESEEPYRFLTEHEFNFFKENGNIYFQSNRYNYQYGYYSESIKQALSKKCILIIESWKSSLLMKNFWPKARVYFVAVLPTRIINNKIDVSKRKKILVLLQSRILKRNPNISDEDLIHRTHDTLDELIEIHSKADKLLFNTSETHLESLFKELDEFIQITFNIFNKKIK